MPADLSAVCTEWPNPVLDCTRWATYIKRFTYCVSQDFPPEMTSALLELADDHDLLEETFETWKAWDNHGYMDEFTNTVYLVTDRSCVVCHRCDELFWEDDTTTIASGDQVCDAHCIDYYTECSSCEEFYSETTTVDRREYCESCLSEECGYCDRCNSWVEDTTSVGDYNYCTPCLRNNFTYCDDCEEWFSDDEDHGHAEPGCDCYAPHPSFTFPADGHGVIEQDERLTVELPKGTIDTEGIARIKTLLTNKLGWERGYEIGAALEEIGPIWQTKRGNFTRRLSSALFKRGIKLDPVTVSEVGNIAQAHSSQGATWHIELTRDLNLPAEAFYHDDSCWWQSYSASRCALKNWGGIGMRSYYGPEAYSDNPSGRIWVQPLAKINDRLWPTHDALHADAYVVFNGYGDLSGYIAARIIAHLAGRTYRKVDLHSDPQYINGDVGYLVADEATCETTDSVSFSFDAHDRRDAYTYTRKDSAA